jgi:hypothetical protein
MTIDQCLSLMISISDNCATYSNVKKTTLAHVNKVYNSLHIFQFIDHVPGDVSIGNEFQQCPSSLVFHNLSRIHFTMSQYHQMIQFNVEGNLDIEETLITKITWTIVSQHMM